MPRNIVMGKPKRRRPRREGWYWMKTVDDEEGMMTYIRRSSLSGTWYAHCFYGGTASGRVPLQNFDHSTVWERVNSPTWMST